jgi:hypothetical protein
MALGQEELYYAKLVINSLQECAQGLQACLAQLSSTRGCVDPAQPCSGDAKQLKASLNFVLAGLLHVRRRVQLSLRAHANTLPQPQSQTPRQPSANPAAATTCDAQGPTECQPGSAMQRSIHDVLVKLINGGHLPQSFHIPSMAEARLYQHSLQEQVAAPLMYNKIRRCGNFSTCLPAFQHMYRVGCVKGQVLWYCPVHPHPLSSHAA